MPTGIYLRQPRSEETKRKISQSLSGRIRPEISDEKCYAWKGDRVGYYGLHKWVQRKLGKPKLCEHCGESNKRKYEWANKSHKYLRDLTDWIRLCTSCHRKYDYQNVG